MTGTKKELDTAVANLKAKLDALKADEAYKAAHSSAVYAKGKTLLIKRGN